MDTLFARMNMLKMPHSNLYPFGWQLLKNILKGHLWIHLKRLTIRNFVIHALLTSMDALFLKLNQAVPTTIAY